MPSSQLDVVNPLIAESATIQGFQGLGYLKNSKPPRTDEGFRLCPEYAAYSRDEAIARLEVSVPTFNSYRRLAIEHIPDYGAISNRIWIERFGLDHMTFCITKSQAGEKAPPIDAPPFWEPQLYILEAVKLLIQRYGDRQLVITKLKHYPTIWRHEHDRYYKQRN